MANIDPIQAAFVITPSDTVDLKNTTRGIMVTVDGNVKVDLNWSKNGVVLPLAANVIYPFYVTRVYATGTTATGILGLL